MNYVLLCGTSAAELTRLSQSPGAIAGVVRENSRQMQQAAKALREAGVPVRNFLIPYIDTVQLQNDSAAFFGSRMLFGCESVVVRQVRQICEPFSLLRVYTAGTLAHLFRTHPLTARRRALLEDALRRCAEPAASLAVLSFSAPPLCDQYARPMARRAQSREVLAFGEICARVVNTAGGEVISCSGGELVFLPGTEKREELLHSVRRVYNQRMPCGHGYICPRRS